MTILEHSPPLSAGDSGYQRIRSDIIFGVLTPSGRLKLESMKEDYGVSVSTLREILNRLASEGFVVAEGQRGFEVAPVSIQNLRELAQLRILLEHHAMTESFRAGDMEWEGRVVSAHHKLAATERAILTEGDDPELRKRYDGEFQPAASSAPASATSSATPTIRAPRSEGHRLRRHPDSSPRTPSPRRAASRKTLSPEDFADRLDLRDRPF